MANPKISVLMSAYNSAAYLRDAIESILDQTYTAFEFIIINDGSKDQSTEIIQSYNDTRIRLVQNVRNLGLIVSLNKGIELARGKYIARMDADDISIKERLEKQVCFFETHQNIGVVGSFIEVIDKNGAVLGYKTFPETHLDICWAMLFYCPIAHPSVMMKASIFKNKNLKYDEEYLHVEDYELWTRLVEYTRFANIPEVLLRHRQHGENVCNQNIDIHNMGNALVIRKYNKAFLGVNIPKKLCKNLYKIKSIGLKRSDDLVELGDYLNVSLNLFIEKYRLSPIMAKKIKRKAKLRWYRWCASCHPYIGWKTLMVYLKYETLIKFDKVVLLLAILLKATLKGKNRK